MESVGGFHPARSLRWVARYARGQWTFSTLVVHNASYAQFRHRNDGYHGKCTRPLEQLSRMVTRYEELYVYFMHEELQA